MPLLSSVSEGWNNGATQPAHAFVPVNRHARVELAVMYHPATLEEVRGVPPARDRNSPLMACRRGQGKKGGRSRRLHGCTAWKIRLRGARRQCACGRGFLGGPRGQVGWFLVQSLQSTTASGIKGRGVSRMKSWCVFVHAACTGYAGGDTPGATTATCQLTARDLHIFSMGRYIIGARRRAAELLGLTGTTRHLRS